MKTKILKLLPIIILFISQISFAFSFPIGVSNTKSQNNLKRNYIKRNYNHFEVKKNENILKNENDITITFEDFSSHFEFGKTRIISAIPEDITIDIGGINSNQKETWIIPDISTMANFKSMEINQISAEDTEILNLLNYGSHVLTSNENNIVELYDLTETDLFFVGYSDIENNELNTYQYDQAKAPIPIELGLEFTSIVSLGHPEFPGDYIQYTDTYYVIGQGTLKTYDDGDVDAMKMIYKEETRDFVDNEEISYSERYEIVFYSKKGHYINAEITDPWNSVGNVTLKNFTYQKLESKTASINDALFSDVKVFPNPINAGETLTIQSQISLEKNLVEVFTINGQKVSTLQFTKTNNNQYQTLVPQKLASGIYFYKVHDQKGGFLKNGKIQIK